MLGRDKTENNFGRSDVAERVLGITCQQQDSKYGTENKQEGNKETNDGSDNQYKWDICYKTNTTQTSRPNK
ncbi:hypothetical protein T06_11018 [Trichinella sp. T6]|nr:hypothetical protein T06_11018 [Trichinella sp. T6]